MRFGRGVRIGRGQMRLVEIPVGGPPRSPEEMEGVVAALLEGIPVAFGRSATELIATVPAEWVFEAAQRLKADDRTRMNYLRCLSSVDYVDRIEVVYHLLSLGTGDRLTLKVALA